MAKLREEEPASVAGFGSAKCSNEEAYLFQKLIRQGFVHNNVDRCTRQCHASPVAALLENVDSGAVSATLNGIENADVAIAIGCNPLEYHPVTPPPGEAKEDWWIEVELAKRLGLDWSYTHPREVFAEMKLNMPSLDNITWERPEEWAVTYPSLSPDDPGQPIVFADGFPRT